jgi:putative nucleotidyltransferase with HDIG domain
MPDRILIDKVRDIVKEKLQGNSWDFENHIMPVVRYAKILAKKLGADEEIVELSAWLHDVTRQGSESDIESHHITGPVEAEKILKGLSYPQDRIEKIKHCIHAHRGSQSIKRETIEAEIVASADAMAHFSDIGVLFYVAFMMKRLDLPGAKEWVRGKLERSWKKLMPEAREIVGDKYELYKKILD